MAETLGHATLVLDTDQRRLDQQLSQAKTKVGRTGASAGASFRQGIQKATIPAALALGAVVVGARKVIGAASDMNETLSKVSVIFGDAAGSVIAWGDKSAKSMGISKQAALDAAAIYGTFGQAAGKTGKALRDFSQPLVQAAADLASFHNVPVDKALEDIRSGLAGETEPLRKYGILLNDAALRQEAMKQGLIKTTKDALSPQNKMLAAQALILGKLGPAQGDFKRTATSAANVEKIQAAETANLNAQIGKGLLPAYQMLQKVLLRVTKLAGEHTKAVMILVGAFAAIAATILLVNAALKVQVAVVALSKLAFLGLGESATVADKMMRLTIIGALIGLAIALIVAYKKSETFRKIVHAAFAAVGKISQATFGWIKDNWPKLLVIIAGPIGYAVGKVIKHWDKIQATAKLVFGKIREITKREWGKVAGFIGEVKDAVEDVIGAVRRLIQWFKDLPGKIGGALKGIPGKIKSAFSFHIPGFSGDGIVSAGGGPGNISPRLYDDLAIGNSMGLTMTSGFRPGSITSTGNHSLHSVYPARAVDMAGSPAAMRSFFLAEVGRAAFTGLAEVIHSPYWWHPGVGISRIPASAGSVLSDHWNHVHVGTYDRGGWLPPGVSLVSNNTGAPERVLGPGQGAGVVLNFPRYVGNRRELIAEIKAGLGEVKRSGGGMPW